APALAVEAFRVFVPGAYDNAFLYMGHLIAVAPDRTLLQADFERIVGEATANEKYEPIARLFLLRNDLLHNEGTQTILRDSDIAAIVAKRIGATAGAFLIDPDVWVATTDFETALGQATALDLQIYAQRLFLATTK